LKRHAHEVHRITGDQVDDNLPARAVESNSLAPPRRRDQTSSMKLAAIHRPPGSFGRPLLALGVTIIFAFTLESGSALGMGHGGGGAGGGGSGGGHGGGGHAGSSGGGGHAGARHVGSVSGHGGSGQVGGGQFAAGHFGHVPSGHQRVFCDHHYGHGFGGLVAVGLPFGVPSYSEYPPYPYGADPYCDPASPWYNPAYWRHRDE